MKNKTILVTGSAGFIGFHVSKKLLENGNTVIGIDNFNNYYDPKLKKSRNKILEKFDKYKIYKGDISNIKFLSKIAKTNKIDYICHLAAQAGVRFSLEKPETYIKSNIQGTLNILEVCRHFNTKKLVYASSSSVYGENKVPFKESERVDHPISLYAATKKSCEEMAYTYYRLFGISSFGLRFFTVYGPYGRPDMALFSFTRNILENKPISVFNNGNLSRDFTYIEDIVEGVIKSLEKVNGYELLNLGRGQPIKLLDFIIEIESALNKKATISMKPMQKGDVPKTWADISKAKKLIQYNPKTSIKEGVTEFTTWYKKYYE